MPKKTTTTTKNLLGNIKKPLHQQCHNRISVQFIQHPSKPRLSLFTTWSLFPFRFFFILFFLNQWKKKRGLPWRYLILSGSSTHFLNPQCYLEFGNQSIHTVSLFQSIPIYRQRRFIRTYASSTWKISHFSSTMPIHIRRDERRKLMVSSRWYFRWQCGSTAHGNSPSFLEAPTSPVTSWALSSSSSMCIAATGTTTRLPVPNPNQSNFFFNGFMECACGISSKKI